MTTNITSGNTSDQSGSGTWSEPRKVKDNRCFLKLLLNLPKEAKNNCPKGFNQLQQGLCGVLRNILPASAENQMEVETTQVTLLFLHNAPFEFPSDSFVATRYRCQLSFGTQHQLICTAGTTYTSTSGNGTHCWKCCTNKPARNPEWEVLNGGDGGWRLGVWRRRLWEEAGAPLR